MATSRRATGPAAKATKAATKATKATKARRATKATSARRPAPPASQWICNLVPSHDTHKDWQLADAVGAGVFTAAPALPATVDLRQPWWTIGNQEQTGSCVGWAVAEGVLRYHFVTAGRLGPDEHLSPRYVWMSSKETDTLTSRPETFIELAGTTLKAAMDVCRNFGVATEAALPFHVSTNMYSGSENTFFADTAQRRILSYFNLRKDQNQWRTWLAGHGPLLVGVSIDKTWDNATATLGNLDTFDPTTVRGGHAVTVVGYLPNGRFIVRNSWDTTWGDGGFGYASPAYIAAGFFDESYGVTI
jgi:hypothetical protein